MPVPETQKRARDKWDAANMTTIGVRLRKDEAARLARLAKANGTTRNAILLKAARDYIQAHNAEQDTQPDT